MKSEVEVTCSIVVRYVLDHLVYEVHFALRQPSLLQVLPYHAAEYPAEILMTGV